MNLLNGYSFRLVARLGLAADVPILYAGEIGWDIDMKVARIGDDTSTPPRIPSDKSLGEFDFSSSGAWKFSQIDMVPGGTIDGVDVSLLNEAPGLVVRKTNNVWGHVKVVSGDNSLQVTNADGVAGNIDVRINPDILALIGSGGYLTEVITSARFTGKGTASSPLEIKASTETQVGATRYATIEEVNAGQAVDAAVTPYGLMGLNIGSPITNHFKNLFQTSLTITTDTTLTGSGASGSPLSVVQATETQRGAAELSTQAEVNAGLSTTTVVTPATLKGLGLNSATAQALAIALGISLPLNISNLVMTGPGLLGRTTGGADQPVQVVPYSTRAKVITGNTQNDQDVVNQATLKTFFPSGLVKIEPLITGDLPLAPTVGKGGIAYDSSVDMLKGSDGGYWRGMEAFMPTNYIWKTMSNTQYSGTGIITLTLLPTERLQIITTAPSGSLTLKVQANISGVWTTVTDNPQVNDNSVVWLARPDGVNAIVLYNAIDGQEIGYPFPGLLFLHSMGPWNLQLRGTASNVVYKVIKFRPYAVDV